MSELIPPPPTLPPGSTVITYLRDSGGDSQEMSIKQQASEYKRYCAQHNLISLCIFTDEAKSGSSDRGRDMFAEMIDYTTHASPKPDGLLIWSLSRFCRNQDDGPYYRALIRKRGIAIHSLTEPLPNDPVGIVIEAMYDFTNAEKIRQTKRDVKRGLHWLAEQGFAPGGFPPRGYKAEEVIIGHKRDGTPRKVSRWVEDPELWKDVKLAWRLKAEGRSYSDIQHATGGRIFTSKNSWPTFFTNKTYLGIGKCGDLEVPDHHPPAIERETWDRVQAIIAKRKRERIHATRQGSPAILASLVHCAHCESRMMYGDNAKSAKARWPYYMCGQKDRHGARSCEGRRVNARKAEAAVLDAVLCQVLTPEYVSSILAELRTQFSDTATIDHKLERLHRQIVDCNRDIANLLELGMKFGALSAGLKLREREVELARLKTEREQVERERKASQVEVTPEALVAVLNYWRNQIAEARDRQDVFALRGYLARFVSRVDLGYNLARIHYKYPVEALAQVTNGSLWGHLRYHNECLKARAALFLHSAALVFYVQSLSQQGPRPVQPPLH